jgi:hypothetical protein
MSAQQAPRDAARAYASAGWPVFPLRFDGKEPLPKSNGFHDATTDLERIDWWWRKDPERNVGIATGAPGPDVVDVDQHGERGNGFAAWNEAKQAGLVDNPRAIITTPSGGMHAYFAGSGQPNGKIRDRHLDFRGRGGYVVAPPSTVGGRPYAVVQHQAHGGTVDWQAIRALVDPQPERKPFEHSGGRPRSLDHLARHVAELQPGNRNDGTYWALCRAAEAGDQAATAAIAEAARSIGLTEREITASMRSAGRIAGQQREPRPFGPSPQRELEAG